MQRQPRFNVQIESTETRIETRLLPAIIILGCNIGTVTGIGAQIDDDIPLEGNGYLA